MRLPRLHLLTISIVALAALLSPRISVAQGDQLCFNVPGISNCIEGRFREYWVQNGGLPVFGYPVSPPTIQQTAEGAFLTQYFERNRFELHPENTRPYDVLLGRLGDVRLLQQGRNWQTFVRPTIDTPHLFSETGFALSHEAFRGYWSSHGLELDGKAGKTRAESLALFGLPISMPEVETNASGDTVLTQWFERARFEDHGPKGVLLGLLGKEAGQPSRSMVTVSYRVEGALIEPNGGTRRMDRVEVVFTNAQGMRQTAIVAAPWHLDISIPVGTPVFLEAQSTYPDVGGITISCEILSASKTLSLDNEAGLPGTATCGGVAGTTVTGLHEKLNGKWYSDFNAIYFSFDFKTGSFTATDSGGTTSWTLILTRDEVNKVVFLIRRPGEQIMLTAEFITDDVILLTAEDGSNVIADRVP